MSRSGITTTNPNDGVPTNRSAKTSTSNNTKAITPISFPTGASARRELKRLLQNTKDPKRTITTFQKKHSLHSFLARGFGTVPSHEANSKDVFFKNQQLKYLNAGGEEGYEKKVRSLLSKETNDDAIAPVIEPFEPESALTFVGHFGVSRHEMHSKISDALRSAVEDNISGVDVNDPKSVEVLLKLLASALPYHVVPELRPVSVNLVKRLGEKTPVEVLKLLASKNKVKDDGGGGSSNAGKSTPSSLIYGEVLQGLGPNLRRLVWEADWNSLIRGDGIPLDQTSNPHTSVSSSLLTDPYLGTIRANNILADMVRPVVEEYVTDKELVKYSDLAFVGTVREKYIHTQKRRTASLGMAGSTSTNTTNCTSKILSGNNNTLSLASVISGNKTNTFSNTKGKENSSTLSSSKKNDSSHTQSSGSAVTKLKKIIGLRPNLLAAVLNMLIAEHGSLTSNESILGGSKYLHCTLVADILISYGNLPRQYEHLGILANILDKCVKIGIVSDQAIAQIQGCLKIIFQPSHEKEKISNVDGTPSPSLNKIMETPKDKATSLMERAATISISTSKSSTKKKINVLRPKVNKDKPFELKLLSKIIKEAIAAMKEIDVQSTFLKPVTDQIAPGYSTVISKPICISDMEKKCINQEYFSLNQYSDDVKLMFQNCITYNTGKDGKWFRSETNRQKKCWNDEIFEQAKDLYKKEMAKRKKVLEKAAALDMSSLKTPNNPSPAITMTTSKDQNNSKSNNRTDLERKRKHDSLLAHQAKLAGKTMSDSKGNNRNNKIGSISNNNNLNKDEGLAIENLTAKNISPLQHSKAKKRKKDFNFPSMPTLVSMLLSDPFVSRLLIDKIYRTVKKDVLGSRIVPSEHFVIPSILQILHVAQFSTQLCAFKGKKIFYSRPWSSMAERRRRFRMSRFDVSTIAEVLTTFCRPYGPNRD